MNNSLPIHPDSKPTPISVDPQGSSERRLRGKSEFLRRFTYEDDAASEQPRALRALARIVEDDLCHRCGTCVGICPTGVLGVDADNYPSVLNLSACTDCDLCVKTCPGEEFNHRAYHERQFGTTGSLTDNYGSFSSAHLSYANDESLRKKGTSGGIITALLVHLLEKGEIDGALVIVADDKIPWHGKPIIARTPEAIVEAAKSKYAITPTNSGLQEILKVPGRYAMVGLPCQIHGLRKAEALDPRLAERIVLSIGLYCHAAVELHGYREVFNVLKQDTSTVKKFTSRIGKHPGGPHIEDFQGLQSPLYFPKKKGYRPNSMEILNILYRLYSPPRCITCFDSSAEFADIAVGDPWMPPPNDDVDFEKGWSFVLLRSERGEAAYKRCVDEAALTSIALTDKEARSCNTMMSTEKRWRAFRVIETHRRQGKAIPQYGEHSDLLPSQNGMQFIKTEINMFTHLFCFLRKGKRPLVAFTFSNFGYSLLFLNNLRRRLRTGLRDALSKMRRRKRANSSD